MSNESNSLRSVRFRKKPVEIEAFKVEGLLYLEAKNPTRIPDWLAEAKRHGDLFTSLDKVVIQTLEGAMTAGPDDWIIRGIKGELYPCKDDVFQASYERVEE